MVTNVGFCDWLWAGDYSDVAGASVIFGPLERQIDKENFFKSYFKPSESLRKLNKIQRTLLDFKILL